MYIDFDDGYKIKQLKFYDLYKYSQQRDEVVDMQIVERKGKSKLLVESKRGKAITLAFGEVLKDENDLRCILLLIGAAIVTGLEVCAVCLLFGQQYIANIPTEIMPMLFLVNILLVYLILSCKLSNKYMITAEEIMKRTKVE